MALFLLSKNAAAFAPAARSIMSTTRTLTNARTLSVAPRIVNSVIQTSSKLFMSTEAGAGIADIEAQIISKGDEIRQLKADGIDKDALAPHIQELVALKAKSTAEIEAQIEYKGNEIRTLKEEGVEKEALAPHIEELLALKAKIAPPADKKKTKERKQATLQTETTKTKAATKEAGGGHVRLGIETGSSCQGCNDERGGG